MIDKGLYLDGHDDNDAENSSQETTISPRPAEVVEHQAPHEKFNYLKDAQKKILATGMSQSQIGARLGVTQQAVHNFITAKSVQTRVLEKYLKALSLD